MDRNSVGSGIIFNHPTLSMKNFLPFVLVLLSGSSSFSQTIIHRDTAIERMVNEISADSLHAYITSMVNYGTRSTISTQKERQKGIGAARNWVLEKFQSFAAQSGGRLSAYIDTTTLLPNKNRLDAPTLLGNVMAVLKGTDTADKRIFVISGHLDSRRTDVMDKTGDSPGANDDGSGVAAVLECARIMSRNSFPATIIFVAVSGEEQGLLGSSFLAQTSKEKGLDYRSRAEQRHYGQQQQQRNEYHQQYKTPRIQRRIAGLQAG